MLDRNTLTKMGNKAFHEVFKSMQLIGFGVLYYNFDFGEKDMIKFNDRIHEENKTLLDDIDEFEEAVAKIEKTTGWDIKKTVREFPYRARVGMMGGLPKSKGNGGLQAFNMVNLQSFSAIESYMVLTLTVLAKDRKWGKTEMLGWWAHMKEEAMTYSHKEMTDNFLVNYLFDELGLNFVNGV